MSMKMLSSETEGCARADTNAQSLSDPSFRRDVLHTFKPPRCVRLQGQLTACEHPLRRESSNLGPVKKQRLALHHFGHGNLSEYST